MKKIQVFGLQTVPEIQPGDNIAEIVIRSADSEDIPLQEKDIVVLTSKIISKSMDLTMKLDDVKPGPRAMRVFKKTGKDPRWLQLIWDNGHEILAMLPLKGMVKDIIFETGKNDEHTDHLVEHEQAICITRSPEGRIHTCDAGIDASNHPDGIVSFVPPDPDEVAEAIREEIKQRTGKNVAVILADTEVIPPGTMDIAVGCSGINPRSTEFGKKDSFGRPKFGGVDLVAYELAAACALVFGQVDAAIPAAIVRGYQYQFDENANIANTLIPDASDEDYKQMIKNIINATAETRPLKERMFLKLAAKFI